ncbi:MAG: polysaccharide deacetylase family protein [Acidobacteriota bacterium]
MTLERGTLIDVRATMAPILSVVIHTEEEFDWGRKFDRSATSVTHMRHIDRVQDLFDAYGIVPTYVVDYLIADQEAAWRPLQRFAADGRALIGAHLHPWVSPPHTEEVCQRNSFPGNLPRDLEYEKLSRLTGRIAGSFGTRPTVYLAGRYGNGANSAQILEELGYEVDVSVNVPMDLRDDDGPDYSARTNHPFWFGKERRLLGLCCSGAFVGWLPAGRLAHHLSTRPAVRWTRLPDVLSRLGAVDRIGLSPEGYTNAELRRLTLSLLAEGFRVFVFYFHSPSVQPGCTPYVRDHKDLKAFLANCRDYFEFFRNELQGQTMTPLEIRRLLLHTS